MAKNQWRVAIVFTLAVVGLLLLLPITVAAATNTEIIAIMSSALSSYTDGVVKIVKLAYCASGISALC